MATDAGRGTELKHVMAQAGPGHAARPTAPVGFFSSAWRYESGAVGSHVLVNELFQVPSGTRLELPIYTWCPSVRDHSSCSRQVDGEKLPPSTPGSSDDATIRVLLRCHLAMVIFSAPLHMAVHVPEGTSSMLQAERSGATKRCYL